MCVWGGGWGGAGEPWVLQAEAEVATGRVQTAPFLPLRLPSRLPGECRGFGETSFSRTGSSSMSRNLAEMC